MAYRKVGEGPDVVLSHGWPASGATFREMLPVLAESFTCHVIDHVGSGDSRFDRTTRISIPDHATRFRRLVDELGLEEFGVVGHNSGGMIARFALATDDRVRGWDLVARRWRPSVWATSIAAPRISLRLCLAPTA